MGDQIVKWQVQGVMNPDFAGTRSSLVQRHNDNELHTDLKCLKVILIKD